MSHRTLFMLGIVLIVILFVSIAATIDWVGNVNSTSEFTGAGFAYSNKVADSKNLVEKVKDCTNLFLLGAVEPSFNKTALDVMRLHQQLWALFYNIVTDTNMYRLGPNSKAFEPSTWIYEPEIWIHEARQKYGDKLWGVYRYDEPGGHQLDQGPSSMLNRTDAAAYGTYSNASVHYVDNLSYP